MREVLQFSRGPWKGATNTRNTFFNPVVTFYGNVFPDRRAGLLKLRET